MKTEGSYAAATQCSESERKAEDALFSGGRGSKCAKESRRHVAARLALVGRETRSPLLHIADSYAPAANLEPHRIIRDEVSRQDLWLVMLEALDPPESCSRCPPIEAYDLAPLCSSVSFAFHVREYVAGFSVMQDLCCCQTAERDSLASA